MLTIKEVGEKYSNALVMINEIGSIPLRCIDEGEINLVINFLDYHGYLCEIDSSTDYLVLVEDRNVPFDNDIEDIYDLYYDWRKESEELIKETGNGSIDCGLGYVREDFSNYADLEEEISFEQMFEFEKRYEREII